MKIRCKKFGDDYTQVQGHEDTIIDFLKDHSFYSKWSYTHEKEKFYNSKSDYLATGKRTRLTEKLEKRDGGYLVLDG